MLLDPLSHIVGPGLQFPDCSPASATFRPPPLRSGLLIQGREGTKFKTQEFALGLARRRLLKLTPSSVAMRRLGSKAPSSPTRTNRS